MIAVINAFVQGVFGWIIAKVLDRFFPKSKENENILRIYELRLKEKEKSIEKLRRESRRQEAERYRFIQALKRSGLSVSKLVERYDKPLNAIIVSYANQIEPTDSGRTKKSKFVLEELEKYGVKYLGATDALIPPARVPKHIRNREHLKAWFEAEILKKRYCKLKFLILFDLRNKSYWDTILPYEQIDPKHFTLGEVLSVEDLFTEEQIKKMALGDIIRDGDIAWLASPVLTTSELQVIHSNQTSIEKDLGNPSLRELSDDKETRNRLSKVLSKYGIRKPDLVSKAIIDEARFWNSKLK